MSLEEIDRIMLRLDDSKAPKADVLKVGKMLYDLGMIDDPTNVNEILHTYNKDALRRIQKNLKESEKRKNARG